MKITYKSLILTGALAFATTSTYAGNMGCQAGNSACHSSKNNSGKSTTHLTMTERSGCFQSSKGKRFCTSKAMKDRNINSTTSVRHHSREWNKEVNASKERTAKNPT